jgi:hypothetical protein
MAILERFAASGNLPEPTDSDAKAWSDGVSAILASFTGAYPQFYDLTQADTPHTAQVAQVVWPAFPARLLNEATSQEQRWALADSDRMKQDEYCEWSVERDDDGKVVRITFTSEVREYWEHMAKRDKNRVIGLYREFVNPNVGEADLFHGDRYLPKNDHNNSTAGRLAHLIQGNNNLLAAVDLVARATILRENANGEPVTHKQALVTCARLGDPFRNSDPNIAAAVNDAARAGAEVALADPPGLYLDGIETAGFRTPDGTDAATFWTIERGTPEHTVRASFAIPEGLDYKVGDIELNGRKIRFGAQLADRVRVRVGVIVKPAGHQPQPRPCGA